MTIYLPGYVQGIPLLYVTENQEDEFTRMSS